jgi:chromate transporter
LVTAAFDGVKAAVLALVIEAMLRIGRRALKSSPVWWIAGASFVALFVFHVPFPLVILAAGLLGLLLAQTAPTPRATETERAHGACTVGQDGRSQLRWSHALSMAGLWTIVWLAPPALSLVVLGPDHMLTGIARLFSTLAVVTFGGAYASLAYLQQAAVEQHHWLTAAQMIDGLGLAETTPGPLVLVHQFVGFLAGWNESGWGLAIAGAAMASWCTFAPSFVWIFAGAPFAERLRANRFAASALAAITAAVLGVIAQLALWFAAHVFFSDVRQTPIGWGASLPIPEWSSFNAAPAILSVAAIVALMRFKLGVVWLVLAAAGAGCLVRLVLAG